ncbi:MAG: 2-C-methyl-D-erythritol 2,4-cyclodiphosphate synthase [Bacteroidetes bacterium]|nr:2-C-methyl-D-erythritol 2,4-cyclodiphosphate synthase [Bacteroidota bacterium]
MNFRIGFGIDIHQLKEGEELWLGGLRIPAEKGAVGYSDADVLIHAIIDALLGALNLNDIGRRFPDTSPEYKNIDSKILLEKTVKLMAGKDYEIVNIDSTVCIQEPKISPYIERIKTTLATVMDIPAENISIKATTTEKLGFEGRQEGITAYAVVLLRNKI